MIEKLPRWIIPSLPFFSDSESGTGIEMVGRVYKKMNELVDNYNDFIETLINDNNTFKAGVSKETQEFAVGLRQEFQDFIDTITLAFENYKVLTLADIEETIDQKYEELSTKLNKEAKPVFIAVYGNTSLEAIRTAISQGRYVVCQFWETAVNCIYAPLYQYKDEFPRFSTQYSYNPAPTTVRTKYYDLYFADATTWENDIFTADIQATIS